jgi:hypothetical protein
MINIHLIGHLNGERALRSNGLDRRTDVNFADVFKLPNSDIQRGKRPGSTDPGRAVNDDRRARIFFQRFGRNIFKSHFRLLFSDPLQEVEHGQGRIGDSIVRPGDELKVTNGSGLTRIDLLEKQVRHDEVVAAVLDFFGVDPVVAGHESRADVVRPVLPALCSVSLDGLGGHDDDQHFLLPHHLPKI